MIASDLTTFGAPYINAKSVEDPEAELDSDYYNRMAEYVGQLTQVPLRAVVKFTTYNASPVPTTQVWHRSLWGDGSSTKPAVTRTGVGLYTITYASSINNGLSEAESVSFFDGWVTCRSGNVADDFSGSNILTVAANVATMQLIEGGAAADQATGAVYFTATAWLV